MAYHKKSKELKLTKKQKNALKSAKAKLSRKIGKLEKAVKSKLHHKKHRKSALNAKSRNIFNAWF